jgi:hypothetical protein
MQSDIIRGMASKLAKDLKQGDQILYENGEIAYTIKNHPSPSYFNPHSICVVIEWYRYAGQIETNWLRAETLIPVKD